MIRYLLIGAMVVGAPALLVALLSGPFMLRCAAGLALLSLGLALISLVRELDR